MSWLTDLRAAVATRTAEESGGLITFRGDGVYQLGELGVHGLVLPERPDEGIALSLVVLEEGLETLVAAQFRYRSKLESRLDQVEDALSNTWARRGGDTLGGVQLILSNWSSGASLGQDGNSRITRSANYYLTVHRPGTNRT